MGELTKTTTTNTVTGRLLTPVSKPRKWILRGYRWFIKTWMKEVLEPFEVIHTRFPESLRVAQTLVKTQKKLTLEPELQSLIKWYVASANGCHFCENLSRPGVSSQKTSQISYYSESDEFSEREKAALAYVDEVVEQGVSSEETTSRLKQLFSEREIVEITWLNAVEHYYNMMNRPLGIGLGDTCEVEFGK